MSKTTKIVLIIVAAVALLFVSLYFIFRGYIPKYRWDENYSYKSDQPYGLKLMHDLLAESHQGKNLTIINGSPAKYFQKKDTSALYIFVGGKFLADSVTSASLMRFVKRGNNVFIAGTSMTHDLFSALTFSQHPILYLSEYEDSLVNVTFPSRSSDSVFTFDYKILEHRAPRRWIGFSPTTIKDTLGLYGFQTVTHINNHIIDCFRVKWGKGWFIFQFNPVLLTNYYLRQEQGLEYMNALLSPYAKSKIYWDEFSKTTLRDGSGENYESPLRFILSERSLRWAWYLICILVILFVIFNAKRKQASIPLLPVNRNTTVEYITAIAALHYQNKSQVYLADEMMKQFKAFVRHKYGISPHLEKDEMVRQLAPVSGIPKDILENLFKRYLDFKYLPEDKYLIEFYELTEYFYQKCK